MFQPTFRASEFRTPASDPTSVFFGMSLLLDETKDHTAQLEALAGRNEHSQRGDAEGVAAMRVIEPPIHQSPSRVARMTSHGSIEHH
jgi:hypothetical protein